METPLRIGLIGCGRAAERIYIPALSRLTEARLVAAADPIPERRDLISSSVPGCLAFSSAEKFFQKVKVAAVIITTPSTTHIAVARMALNAGVSVLCEKPLAPSMAGVEEVEAVVNSSKGLFMMGFNRRHWKAVNQLRQKISKLRDHDTVSTELVTTTNKQAWSSISEVNDVLDDLGSHQLDLLRYIYGHEISTISAHWTNRQEIRLKVKLSGGGTASCVAAYSKRAHEESVTVNCGHKKYRIYAGSDRTQPASGIIRLLLDRSDASICNLRNQKLSFEDSYRLQLISFINCVRNGSKPQSSIADGIAAIHAVEAARQSATAQGKEVQI
jgi:predicted dehydrogenase